MKQLMRNDEENDVFEFKDDEYPDDSDRWSKIRAKFENPNLDYDDFNSQFLHKNSSGPITQIKEVPTVTLDDDDDDDTDDSSADPLDSAHKPLCEESEGLYPMPDSILEQHSGLTDSNVEHKSSPPCTQMRVSTSPEYLPEKGHVFPVIPETPYSEGSPSTSDSEPEETNVPTVGQDSWQSVGGLEMDVMDTVVIHTDYIIYGEKYFPASLILFSRDSVTIKTSVLDEEPSASISEWKLDDILQVETQRSSMADVTKVRIRLLMNNSPEIVNETSGAVVVEFLVSNWSHHQEQITSLDMRYSAFLSMGLHMQSGNEDAVPLEDSECSSDPYIPNFEEHFEDVVYPKGEIDAVSLRKSDVDLLLPEVFINDTIIDFYITYLKNGIPQDRRHNFHFFNSFFFRKLADLDKNPSSIFDGKAAFQRVRRWTRKVNIFEKDFIFIPVNYNLHWSLIIVCHPGEAANFNDENIDKALKVPCILHMDSIRGSHAGLKDLLQSYLLEEWKERQKETSVDVSSKFLNLRFLSLELPQQENCFDCGLFLLHYAELFIDEAPEDFSPFLINEFDHFLKPDWFMPAEASLKRVHIQRLIYELLKSISQKCVSPPRNYLSHSQPVNKENGSGIEILSEKVSLEKSWNGSSLYSEPAQGMEMGLLDMPTYRPPHCIDSSGIGMTELLEQQCQHYDRGSSLGRLDFSMSTVTEQTGLQPIDQPGQSHIVCSSGDFDQGFQWNLDLSDQGDPDDSSYSSDSHSCDDNSSEETKILECNSEIQSVSPCQNDMDHSKENVESQEGYASAPSDMMETPAEDSQELAEKYGSHDYDQEDPYVSNLEDVVEASEEPGKSEHEEIATLSSVDDKLVVENGKDEEEIVGIEESLVVGDSCPDQLRPAKRLRVSPSPGDESVRGSS